MKKRIVNLVLLVSLSFASACVLTDWLRDRAQVWCHTDEANDLICGWED
jgi:hypothetical protein